jgi:acetyl-CoA carboxylase alpha subunit
MPMTSKLGTLISYDSVADRNQIAKTKMEIESEGLKVQKTIEQIIKDNNEKFHQQVQQRSMQIEDTFKKNFPAISEKKKEEIQNHVHEAMEKGESHAKMDEIDIDGF